MRRRKPAAERIGFCIKDSRGKVLQQNAVCEKLCGIQIGNICKDGCMENFKPEANPLFDRGLKARQNVSRPGGMADTVLIHDGEEITTLLYEKEPQVEAQITFLAQFGLSKTELEVMRLSLQGATNREIARQLFVSPQTVKTHLNNIYKKVPTELNLRR